MRIHHLYYANWKLIIYTISSFLFPSIDIEDNQVWASIEINKDIAKSINIELAHQVRYKGDEGLLDKTISELSLSSDINSEVKISVDYRYAKKDENVETRYGLNLKYDLNGSIFIPSYKIKFQQEYGNNNEPDLFLIRNKLTFDLLEYKSFKSSIYYESYHRNEEDVLRYYKYRLSSELEYSFSSTQAIELFYIYKGVFKKNHIDVTNITGIKFEYSF